MTPYSHPVESRSYARIGMVDVLGVAVAAAIALLALGKGTQASILEQFTNAVSNRFFVV